VFQIKEPEECGASQRQGKSVDGREINKNRSARQLQAQNTSPRNGCV